MIFWLCVIILVVSIVIAIIADREFWEGVEIVSCIIAVSDGIAIIVMAILLCINYSTADADIARNEEIYRALTYKVESEACKDEFGLLSKEVIDEIQEWNESVLHYQKMQDNFWIGIFYPDVFDQFKTIDYNKYSKQ